jgi:outer membrane protein assembly factor BamB
MGGMAMKRTLLIVLALLFIFPSFVHAAPKLESFNKPAETRQKAQIIWQLSGLGKPSEQPIALPDGRLLILTGNKMFCVDQQGKLLWEAKAGSGKMGNPVLSENGSIFTAAKGTVTEIKPNGVSGWSFVVLPGGKDKEPQMAGGKNDMIYLPLPHALYALDARGHTVGIFSPWDNTDRFTVKSPDKRTFMTCAADAQAFYAVYADEKSNYKMIAIDNKGKHLWTYWLGDVLSAHILAPDNDKIYITATLKPSQRQGSGKSGSSKLNRGVIYCFNVNEGKRPIWQYGVRIEGNLTAPVLAGDKVYVCGGSNFYVLDAATGSLKLENRLLNLISPPAVDTVTGRLYAGSSKGSLYAVDLSSGRLDWARELEGAIEQAPIVSSDGFIYVCTQKGSLYKIRDNTGGKE